MSYSAASHWNDRDELRCLLIFKKLEAINFSRGKQMNYCREMAKNCELTAENISAKVGNYKSVAGVNNKSNASKNTKSLYKKYANCSIEEIIKIIEKN